LKKKTFRLVAPSDEVVHSPVVTRTEHYDRMFDAAMRGAGGETQAERETNQRLRTLPNV
jgi:hypothetical protein